MEAIILAECLKRSRGLVRENIGSSGRDSIGKRFVIYYTKR